MNQNKIVKQLIFFAKREFKEKKTLAIQVLRIKGEQVLTKGGPLKVLSLKRVVGAYYLVLVEYKEDIRVYLYSKNGKLLEGRNFEQNPKLLADIRKSTVREFSIGKN
ncbi:MAG: hypothetical protein ACFFDF_20290 [Candidatus Odinarchaeota archaeon]